MNFGCDANSNNEMKLRLTVDHYSFVCKHQELHFAWNVNQIAMCYLQKDYKHIFGVREIAIFKVGVLTCYKVGVVPSL